MNELDYEQLNAEQQAMVDRNPKTVTGTSRYVISGNGMVIGYRLAEMFSNNVPIKWGAPLSLETDQPLPKKPGNITVKKATAAGSTEAQVMTGTALLQATEVRADGSVRDIAFDLIDRSPLQPRVVFNRERLDELKQSIREHGFVKEMSHLWLRPSPASPGRFELIDGERRWIVVGELIREEGFPNILPGAVSEVSDEKVLEYALVNALQRESLSPMEEASAICRRIEMSRESSGGVISNRELASHLGCKETRIRRALLLYSLRATPAGEEIESGRLPVRHGEVLARVASPKKRDELTKRILNPSDKRGVLPLETLEQWIKDEVHVDLRKAEFDLLSADLVPLKVVSGDRVCGGPCADKLGDGKNPTQWNCPFVDVKPGGAMCTNPDCYKAKQAVSYDAWCSDMVSKGYKVLSADEAERMWDDSGKRVIANAGLVEITASPEEWELKEAAIAEGKWQHAKWKTLIKGMPVEVLALKDRTGAEHLLVNREKAKAAAVENGYDIFRGQKTEPAPAPAPTHSEDGTDVSEGDPRIEAAARDVKAEAARLAEAERLAREARIEDRYERLLNRSLIDATRGLKKLEFDYWRLVLAPMAETVKENDGLLATCLALGLSEKDVDGPGRTGGGMSDEALASWLNETIENTPAVHLPSVALILSRHMLYASEVDQWMKLAGKTFGVDGKKVRKQAGLEVDAEISAETEQRDIETGIDWLGGGVRREKADQFEWLDDGYSSTPNIATVRMPKGVKNQALIATARAPKGWAFGFEFQNPKGKALATGHANRNDAIYDNEALAIKAALLALQKAMEDHQAPEPALKRIAAYIANVKLPEAPPKKAAKPAKKKGARK